MLSNLNGTPTDTVIRPPVEEIEPALQAMVTERPLAEKNMYSNDRAYCQYNMLRRAGGAELHVQQTYGDGVFLRRVAGSVGVDWPSASVVLGVRNAVSAVFCCIDRISDFANIDLGSPPTSELRNLTEIMDEFAGPAGCEAFVIFSMDPWQPGGIYEDRVTWYAVPWRLARALGPLHSRKTRELQEFVLSVDEDTFEDSANEDLDEEDI